VPSRRAIEIAIIGSSLSSPSDAHVRTPIPCFDPECPGFLTVGRLAGSALTAWARCRRCRHRTDVRASTFDFSSRPIQSGNIKLRLTPNEWWSLGRSLRSSPAIARAAMPRERWVEVWLTPDSLRVLCAAVAKAYRNARDDRRADLHAVWSSVYDLCQEHRSSAPEPAPVDPELDVAPPAPTEDAPAGVEIAATEPGPCSVINDWLDALPPNLRSHVLLMLSGLGMPSAFGLPTITDVFATARNDQSGWTEVGVATMAASLIDVALSDVRTRELVAAETPPFVAAQWRRSLRSWEQLREGPLSETGLFEWLAPRQGQ
jgi:hypothetical protein